MQRTKRNMVRGNKVMIRLKKPLVKERLSRPAQKDNDQNRKHDLMMKKQGLLYKTSSWIHGMSEDLPMIIYSKVKLTGEEIGARLKKAGSVVFTDYNQSKI
uniref:Uncharacterized protein n=1 Tax=viral metagenome TaxID=1070528 RepID=A0A6M3ILV7_9ZZZZ